MFSELKWKKKNFAPGNGGKEGGLAPRNLQNEIAGA